MAVSAAAILAFGQVAAAGASPAGPSGVDANATDLTAKAQVSSSRLAAAKGQIAAYVRFSTSSGETVYDAKQAGGSSGSSQASAVAQEIAAKADRIQGALQQKASDVAGKARSRTASSKVRRLYVTKYALPGVALTADAQAFRDLASQAKQLGIVSITPIVPKTIQATGDPDAKDVKPDNAWNDALVDTIGAWSQTGQTGAGHNIAIIDTGLDYTHLDFGGAGTTGAYAQALASTADPLADPALRSLLDPAKFQGGTDFAGPTYNADPSSSSYDPTPRPDANPIDGKGGGHGTHVAGTSAGYGIDASGSNPAAGDYPKLTAAAVKGYEVGPGAAPEAGIYSLKVFGDGGGSTDLVGEALDWVSAHNAGLRLGDPRRIDVVNMSLGSDAAPADDPENLLVDALADQGTLSVSAAGNAGDITDVAGSPGNATKGLAVAASSHGHAFFDALTVTAPDAAVSGAPYAGGAYPGQYSVYYAGDARQVSGAVATPDADASNNGCRPYTDAEKQKVAGKIAWIAWDDANIACGSATIFTNAQAAGAIGVVLESTVNAFSAGIAGNAGIPGLQLTKDGSDALRADAIAGDLRVTLDTTQTGVISQDDPTQVDTLAAFSSRGDHGSFDGLVKPDVAAPGVSTLSAGSGTGTGAAVMSGTSMATPLTAGVALLADAQLQERLGRAARVTTIAQITKQTVINTAAHDVTEPGTGTAYGPLRAGTGRIDAKAAVSDLVTVGSNDDPLLRGDQAAQVSASFGVIKADVRLPLLVRTRTLTVANRDGVAHTYALSYAARTSTPGASYSLSRRTLTVRAHSTARFAVTLRITPTALRHTIDPTQASAQSGIPRTYVTDASGVVELKPVAGAGSTLRVAVFAAPKPVARTAAVAQPFRRGAESTSLRILGRGLAQGSGSTAYTGLVVPLAFGASDPSDVPVPRDADGQPVLADTARSGDILAVGASSTAPQLADPSQGYLSFGVQTAGDWASLEGYTVPVVYVWTGKGGAYPDTASADPTYVVYVQGLASSVDLPVAVTTTYTCFVGQPASGEDCDQALDVEPVNGQLGDVDTSVSDNNVVALPVALQALGIGSADSGKIAYRTTTWSAYATALGGGSDGTLDQAKAVDFDAWSPSLWFGDGGQQSGSGQFLFEDAAGSLPVHRTSTPGAGSAGYRALLLHLHSSGGSASAEKVTIRQAGRVLRPAVAAVAAGHASAR